MMTTTPQCQFKLTLGRHWLTFIDSFQFLSLSVDSTVKNLNKDDPKYLIQEFDNNVLHQI